MLMSWLSGLDSVFEASVTPGLSLMTGFWYTREEAPLRVGGIVYLNEHGPTADNFSHNCHSKPSGTLPSDGEA